MSARVVDLSPAKLIGILGLTFVLLSAGMWFTLIAPKQSQTHAVETSITSANAQLGDLTKNQAATHKAAVSQSKLVERALPNVTGMPQIVLQFSRIADEEHVSLDAITPSTPVPYAGYQATPITLIVTGDFFNVEGFLAQVRSQVQVRTSSADVAATGRLYDVTGVTLQSVTPAPKVTATITVDGFSYTGLADSTVTGTTPDVP